MKRKYFIFAIALILSFVLNSKVYADCPPGWNGHWDSVMYSYQVGGFNYICKVWVNYCCRWNPETQQPEIIFQELVVEEEYRDCLKRLFEDSNRWLIFYNTLYLEINKLAKQDQNCFPECPPCVGEPALFSTLKASLCIKWISKPALVLYNGRVLEWAWGIKGCNFENYCQYTYACCTDWNSPNLETYIWLVSVQQYGIPNCTTNIPQIPPPGKDWDEPWETECFAQPCQ